MQLMARNWLVGLSLLVNVAASVADLGDPAAELNIAKWVKGEPVKVAAADGKIYVVEFWATWCPPCRTSIPHLTEIQKRFKDKNVVIVGISDEKENLVAPFVEKLGSKMDYRVALDDKRKTSTSYMQAYGIGGIPHAFVVRDQKVIWQGHPMDGLDKALELITSNKYDLAKARAKAKAEALHEQFREAVAEGDEKKADELSAKLQPLVKEGAIEQFDPEKEKKEIQVGALRDQFQRALMQREERKAEEFGAKLKALDPEVDIESLRDEVKARELASKYFEQITSNGAAEKREQAGNQLAAKLKSRPELANNIAWSILTQKAVVHRDFDFVARIAKQACEDEQWKNAGAIDTYARALFEQGKREEAIRYQEKAIAAAAAGENAELEKTLQSYKAGQLPALE